MSTSPHVRPRPIGILGGTSWPSTIEYYRTLNELAQHRLGGFHSANLLLRSIDYHPIKRHYHTGWEFIPDLLGTELRELAQYHPCCILIANNTLHRAYDQIEQQLNFTVPVVHIVDAVGARAQALGMRTVLLLATSFTMEDGFYAARLARFGLHTVVPDARDRATVQGFQNRLAQGEPCQAECAPFFSELIARYRDLDAVVLGCTEIPLVVSAQNSVLPVLDSGRIQCERAFELYMGQQVLADEFPKP